MDTAQTADHALRVLEFIRRDGPSTVPELASELFVSRSTMRRVVETLHRRALLTRRVDARYVLGPGLISLARNLPHDMVRLARPVLHTLAVATEELVVLSIRDGDVATVAASRDGGSGPLHVDYPVGFQHPLSAGGSGLAILAFLDPEPQRRLLADREMERHLAVVRTEGVAKSDGELGEAISDLAAPVFGVGRVVEASVALAVPSIRSHRLAGFVVLLRESAELLSRQYAAQQRSGEPQ